MTRLLSEHESYVQMLRAMRRLRSKRLISGPYWANGAVCAAGAAAVHQRQAETLAALTREIGVFPITKSMMDWYGDAVRFAYNNRALESLVNQNEDFCHRENGKKKERARYKHVVAWLEAKVTE
jgi:hypothetical protein